MKKQIEKDKYRKMSFDLHQLVLSLEKEQIDIEDPESGWYNITFLSFHLM